MDEILEVLEPLSQAVHFVLIGKGADVIRFQHSASDGALEVCQGTEEAQLAAMAMALIKRGFPHVSILEGGGGAVLRYLWRCEGKSSGPSQTHDLLTTELGLHTLVDVNYDEINRLFEYLAGTMSPQSQSTTAIMASKLTTAAVTEMFSSSMNSTYNMFRKR